MSHEQGGGEADEQLRQRLYRPGASEADVAAYTRTLSVDEPDAGEEAQPDPLVRPRRGRAAAAGVLVIALIGVVLVQNATGVRPAPITSPRLSAAVRDPLPTPKAVVLPIVADRGPREFARGPAATSAAYPGRFQYTVAEGDTVIGLASRFGLCRPDIERSLPADFDRSALQPGQVLILGRIDDDTERLLIRSGTC